MNQINCYNCKSEISSEATYCRNCGIQVKCTVCKSNLNEGENFCFNCGEKIFSNIKSENRAVNNIEYVQKGNSKTFKANFTDNVGVYLAGAFNSVITGQALPPKNPFQKTLQKPVFPNHNNTASMSSMDSIEEAEIIEVDYASAIAKIFKQTDDGRLEIIDNRFKEKSQRDKMKRLSVLFLYAKKALNVDNVTRKELNDIIVSNKLGGGNFRKFLSNEATRYFSTKEDGSFYLLAAGEEEARKILNEINNPDFHASVSRSGRKAGKKSSQNNSSLTEKESKASNTSNPSALEMCTTLIEAEYFSNKRKLNDICLYSEQKKARKYSPQSFQSALSRLVKDQILERDKNTDGQYEYWKK